MTTQHFDYIVIGAGPAGLQMGYFLKRSGRDYAILEAGNAPGTFFKKYPTHRKLISANKIYTGYTNKIRNMRWDWNSLISDDDRLLFKNYSREYFPPADAMVDYLSDFAEYNDLNIYYSSRVSKVCKGEKFEIDLEDGGRLTCNKLIMGSGVSKPYIPDIPGVDQAELYGEASVDPDNYVDQKVLVVGKGNSAFETADNLIATASRIYVCSPTPITLSWKSKFVGHLRAVNNNFLDTYQLKLQNVMLDAELVKIERKGNALRTTFHYAHADDEVEEMEFDRVILCTGFRFDASIFDKSCMPELRINDRFPAQKSNFESTNIDDLYFIGTLMQERDFKKKQSGFVHGFRHNIESLHHILEEKYHGVAWPSKELPNDASALAKAVLDRANLSPGLWQQTGFICDVLVRDSERGTYRYFEDVPKQYVDDSWFSHFEEYHVITLEFGLDIIYASPDPLAVDRIHKDDVDGAHMSTGIHPIVQKFSKGVKVGEHHVLEDIIPEWDEEGVHHAPLESYFLGANSVGSGAEISSNVENKSLGEEMVR